MINKIYEKNSNTKIYLESIYPVNNLINKEIVETRTNENIKDLNNKIEKICNNKCTYINMYDNLTDKNGNIEFTLPYGTYTLRQISTKDGVDKVEDKIIEVTKDGVIQKIALVNHFLPKEKVPEEKKEEVLPNTGKHSFPLYIMLLSISSLITIYEKSRN